MAAERDLKKFISNSGTEARYVSSSVELCAPTEATSELTTPYPYAKPYATAAEIQMWTAVDMLKQLEVKLRPIYDGLIHHRSTQEQSECLEQQNRIMQACETILETCKIIESKLACEHVHVNQPAAVPVPHHDDLEVCATIPTHTQSTIIFIMLYHGYRAVSLCD